MSAMIDVTEATFAQEVEQAAGLTIVDFWAPWCGPCKMLTPILEQIAVARAGTVKVTKVNSDDHPRLSVRFGVRGIPMMLFFKGGKPVAQIVGAVPRSKIEATIDQWA